MKMAKPSSAIYGGKWRVHIVQGLTLDFIRDAQCKVWVVERFSHSYAMRRIESKKLLNEVQKVTIDNVSWWDDFLDDMVFMLGKHVIGM